MADYSSNPWLQQAEENNAYATNLVKTDIPDDREDDFMKSSAGMYARREAARRAYLNYRRRLADVKDDEGSHDDNEYLHIAEDDGCVYVRNDSDGTKNKFDSWADALAYISSLHGDEKATEKDIEDEDKEEKEDRRHASYRLHDYTRRASYRRRPVSTLY